VSGYTDLQLDALRELANIGSGTAGTALSGMIGRAIDVSVPQALALPLADAVEAVGDPGQDVTGIVLPVIGDVEAIVLMLFDPADEACLCDLLGVEPAGELGRSAMSEIGNILSASYVRAFGAMTGLELEPEPPILVHDMRGAIVASALAPTSGAAGLALLLDSDLRIEGERCNFTFLLLPTAAGVDELLLRLGVAG
jgi:chemotaxis protein CheC